MYISVHNNSHNITTEKPAYRHGKLRKKMSLKSQKLTRNHHESKAASKYTTNPTVQIRQGQLIRSEEKKTVWPNRNSEQKHGKAQNSEEKVQTAWSNRVRAGKAWC